MESIISHTHRVIIPAAKIKFCDNLVYFCGVIRQFKHKTVRKAQMVITLEFSLLTFESNVTISRLAFDSYATLTFETEVQGLTFGA